MAPPPSWRQRIVPCKDRNACCAPLDSAILSLRRSPNGAQIAFYARLRAPWRNAKQHFEFRFASSGAFESIQPSGPLSLRPCRAQDTARRHQVACSSCRGKFPAEDFAFDCQRARAHSWFACRPKPPPYRIFQAGEGSCIETNVRRGLRAASTSGTSRLGSAEPRAANRIVSPRQPPAQPIFVCGTEIFDDSLSLLLNDRLLLSDPMSLHAAKAPSATSLKPMGWSLMNSRLITRSPRRRLQGASAGCGGPAISRFCR